MVKLLSMDLPQAYEPSEPAGRWMAGLPDPADTPCFEAVIIHAAVNHTVNGVRVRSKIVPAVTDTRREHS